MEDSYRPHVRRALLPLLEVLLVRRRGDAATQRVHPAVGMVGDAATR